MYVEVRPIPDKKWHNKKGKDSFAMPKVVEALYDSVTGKYATGLTAEDLKTYQALMPGVRLDNDFDPNEPHPFWSTKAASVKLENMTMIFDTTKPMEYIKVKLMKANKLVANSQRELEEGKWPDATHVIFDEEEEVSSRASKIALRDECTLIKMKMTDDDKANMVQILSNKSIKGRSTDFINTEISAVIEENPEEFLRVARMGKEETYVRAAVLEAIHKNVLSKEGGSIYYMGEMIGVDYDDAVRWFKDPKNNRLKILIMEKLTNAKK